MSPSTTLPQHVTIGFSCRPKKKIELFNDFVVYCKEHHGIKVIELDLEKDNLPPVDIYLCKVTDDLNSTDETAERKRLHLRDYLEKHPNILCMEPIEKLEPILTRERMCETFREIGIGQPEWRVVQSLDEEELTNVTYPVVVKAQAACGTEESHHMALVFNKDQFPLKSFINSEGPYLVQQFVNHDAKVYKIYVLGEYIIAQIRDSFPNFEPQDQPLYFHSQKLPIKEVIGKHHMSQDEAKKMFGTAVTKMRQRLKMDLFGIDIIIDAKGKQFVIDFNFFPGYYGVEKRMAWLIETIERRYGELKEG